YAEPRAAVMAIQAGCDAVLICSGDYAKQGAALEALVHAIEQEDLPGSRVEDALRRTQLAKERFLPSAALPRRPRTGRALLELLEVDKHRAVADEMAQFA